MTRGGQHISLTRTEFALLQVFMENPRRVMERSTLLNEVWGFEFPTTANSLEVYIGYLRRKTEVGGRSRLIRRMRKANTIAITTSGIRYWSGPFGRTTSACIVVPFRPT